MEAVVNKTERKIVEILVSQMTLQDCCYVYFQIKSGENHFGQTLLGMLPRNPMSEQVKRFVLKTLAKRIHETKIPEPLDNFSTV